MRNFTSKPIYMFTSGEIKYPKSFFLFVYYFLIISLYFLPKLTLCSLLHDDKTKEKLCDETNRREIEELTSSTLFFSHCRRPHHLFSPKSSLNFTMVI